LITDWLQFSDNHTGLTKDETIESNDCRIELTKRDPLVLVLVLVDDLLIRSHTGQP